MRGCLRGCLIGAIVLIVIAAAGLLAAGYFGLVPAVAHLIGTDRPRDLGVHYTQADLDSYYRKSQTQIVSLPPTADPASGWKATGQVAVNSSFTDEELTAVLATGAARWRYWPVKEGQMRINPDGSVEVAAALNIDGLVDLARQSGASESEIQSALSTLKIAGGSVPVYVKASGAIVNGKSDFHVQRLEIGRLSVPLNYLTDNRTELLSVLDESLKSAGVQAKSLSFADGTAKFDGTLPASRSMIASK